MRVPTRLPRPDTTVEHDGAAGLAAAHARTAGWSGIAFTLLLVTATLLLSCVPGLAAGVLFVALLFTGAAASGAAALVVQFSAAPPLTPDVTRGLTATGYTLVFVYAVRAAGIYMLTTTGLARAAGVVRRPVALITCALAAVLLASATFHPAILLVFPAWVLLMSVLLLVRRPTGVPS